MALIPEAVLDEIHSRVDIAEVIGNAVKLTRSGQNLKARCPFHKEKTASFWVNTEKQIFHCFGCGVGGNVFSFLMQHDRLTFPEAVRLLADKVGVSLPQASQEGPSRQERDSAQSVLEKCSVFFEKTLAHPEAGKSARDYVMSRGVTQEVQAQYRLGVALEGWDRLIKAAQSAGVSLNQLEQAGLVVPKDNRHYDRFRNRLMFPILDVRGRVIGFGGRALGEDNPKYLNSPETSVYQKSHHLYGLCQAKEAIVEQSYAVIVEGYFDCVVLASAGIKAVVAPLGTALTVQQVRLLKRYTERVILAFDADAAGEAATRRGIDLLVEAGLNVSVLKLPEGQDPDDYVREVGTDVFKEKILASQNIFEFLLDLARKQFPEASIESKVKAARQVLPTVAKLEDGILQSEYLRLLAGRLQLDELSIRQEMKRLGKAQEKTFEARPSTVSLHSVPRGPEQTLTALLLEDSSRWKQVEGRIVLQDFEDPELIAILEKIKETAEQGLEAAVLMSRIDSQGAESKIAELITLADTLVEKDVALEDCIKRIENNQKQRRLVDLRSRIRVAQDAGQSESVYALLSEYQRQVKGG